MAIKEKDKIIEVNALEIPEELKELPQWVLWRAEWNEKQQQFSKVPYSFSGYRASSTNKDTWTIFDVINRLNEDNENYNGIGFMLSDDDNYIVLDIDNAIDEHGQIISDLALDMTEITYCEKSPSGTGLHCFFKGQLPSERKKKRSDLDIELYDNARFMTVTGETIGQSEINDDQNILDNLVERYFKEKKSFETTITYAPNHISELSDDEVIDLMLKSKQKDKISDLLKGNYEPYFDSPSILSIHFGTSSPTFYILLIIFILGIFIIIIPQKALLSQLWWV
jgi:putative DNA primase/helicase